MSKFSKKRIQQNPANHFNHQSAAHSNNPKSNSAHGNNKETYFNSGKLRGLHPGKYYTAHRNIEEKKILIVVMTKLHVNGNLAFAIFDINDASGQIEEVQYDYNTKKANLALIMKEDILEEFENKDALESLVYQAEVKSRQIGKIHKDFWLAEKIMGSDKEMLLGTKYARLAAFQSPTKVTDTSLPIKKKEKPDIQQNSQQPLLYSTKGPSKWDGDKWRQFFKRNLLSDQDQIQEEDFQPLVYLYSQTQLPLQKIAPKTDKSLYSLRVNARDIDFIDPTHEFKLEGNTEENSLITKLQQELKQAKKRADYQSIVRTIRNALNKYPQNDLLHHLLYRSYKIQQQHHMACETAINNYKYKPDRLLFILPYLEELLQHGKMWLLKRFFKKGLLMESHIAHDTPLSKESFVRYYYVLGSFFIITSEFIAYWQLYAIIRHDPEFYDTTLLNDWYPLFTTPAKSMVETIKSASESQKEAWINHLKTVQQPGKA